MGMLGNLLNPSSQSPPVVPSILPQAAKSQIMNGRLPNLIVDKILLKPHENCHYADKAIYEKVKINKRYIRRNAGVSMPGLFKGNRVHFGNGDTQVAEQTSHETIKGYLFITNERIVFVAGSSGFSERIENMIAITPYANCVEMQFKNKQYKVFVPDGNIVERVVRMAI